MALHGSTPDTEKTGRHAHGVMIKGDMMNKKIFIANIVLLVIILGLGYLVATTHYVPPQSRSYATREASQLDPSSDLTTGSKTVYETSPAPKDPQDMTRLVDKYPNLGKTPFFDTIIPKPTPVIRPSPTPAPPPDINAITARWKLSSMFANTATFQDTASKNEWTMTVGSAHEVQYRNQSCSVKLEKVDEDTLEVTISFGEQQKKFTMW